MRSEVSSSGEIISRLGAKPRILGAEMSSPASLSVSPGTNTLSIFNEEVYSSSISCDITTVQPAKIYSMESPSAFSSSVSVCFLPLDATYLEQTF